MAPIPTKVLIETVSDLHPVSPWRGLAKSLLGLGAVMVLSYLAYQAPTTKMAVGWAVLLGFAYSSLLILTHDALHTTLTGWKSYDYLYPRIISAPMCWFHALYSEIHALHHKMNGQDTRDPERVEPTQAEYDAASAWGKFYYRHQWWIQIFVFGGWGMIASHIKHSRPFWQERPSVRKAFYADLTLILIAQISITVFALSQERWLRWFLIFNILERVIGLVHQFRSHIEHYGLWGKQGSPLDTQVFTSRNFATNPLIRFYLNGLNYHSVHHAFPRIPFYNLREAQGRLSGVYAAHGQPWKFEKSYLSVFWDLANRPRFIGK